MKTTSCTGECFNPKNSDTYNLIDHEDFIDNDLDETASNLDISASVVAKRRLRKLTAANKQHNADDRDALRHGGLYRPPKGHQSNSSTATASATTVLQTSTNTIGGGGSRGAAQTTTTNNTPTTATTSATTNCSRNNHHNCTCVSRNCRNFL